MRAPTVGRSRRTIRVKWRASRLTPRVRRQLSDPASTIVRFRSPAGRRNFAHFAAGARTRVKTIPAWVWLLLVLAVGTFLRLHALDRLGFNSDEAVYAGQAASISGSKAFLKYFPIYRAHPVLYQGVVSIAYHFVLSDFVARLS